MVGTFRPRRLLRVALLGAFAFGLAACNGAYPNSTFNHTTEYNTAIDNLWDTLLLLGTIVFVLTEAGLIYTIYRFRRRPGAGTPKQVHGNTTLEIAWTAIPAVILIFIAIPTVRTIFKTQAKAAPNALQVEVIGHQWWWEFRYPQYGIVTANELYLPTGRTVNFSLKTADVLHSFWIPQLGGKRDLISNRTNFVWFTPNADLPASAFNGACAEFCGASHANMKFRTYAVAPAEFEMWAAHQKSGQMFQAPPPVSGPSAPATAPAITSGNPQARADLSNQAAQTAVVVPVVDSARPPVWAFPKDRIDKDFAYTIPNLPMPEGLDFDESLLGKGDPARGNQLFIRGSCIGCHAISGYAGAVSNVGPNLTHVATRWTIAAGTYPNDASHLAHWIKNAPVMKPGALMPTIGKGQYDPRMKMISAVGLTDAEIADLVAYLQTLK